MPPLEITVIELMFGLRLQDYFLESKLTSLKIGKTQSQIYELMKSHDHLYKVTGDFSKYDQSIPS